MVEDRPPIDRALLRGLTLPRFSRRDLFRYAGTVLGGAALSSLLQACGRSTSPPASGSGTLAATFDWSAQQKAGTLNFANWPLYMDKGKVEGEVVHPSLQKFTEDTGIEVQYREVINDYASFFGKLEPLLSTGQDTGFDLIVMGYPKWTPLMIKLGYLIPLDQSALTNFRTYADPKYQDPVYDPGNRYSVAWQSGITGIGYDPELTGREITSVMDLFDPALRGRVGMLGDTLDMPNLTLLGLGVEPTTSTPDDWQKAADLLTRQKDDGIVRQYFGQNYIAALQRGDVALTMAWASDIFQSNQSGFPNLRFAVPEEGALLWTDDLMIPVGAQHPVDAMTYMDFVYQPEVAAMIEGWIQAVCPVPAAKDILSKQGEEAVADSPLVFPTPDMYERLHGYRDLSEDEEQRWNALFEPIFQG